MPNWQMDRQTQTNGDFIGPYLGRGSKKINIECFVYKITGTQKILYTAKSHNRSLLRLLDKVSSSSICFLQFYRIFTEKHKNLKLC